MDEEKLATGTWLDDGDAWLIALTRHRRAEAAARRRAARPETLRYAVRSYEYERSCADGAYGNPRRKASSSRWRRRQWAAGNRRCTFCNVYTVEPRRGYPPTFDTCTVDHLQAICNLGADAPENWAICCWLCNNRKGSMSEADFRAMIAVETACRVAGTMPQGTGCGSDPGAIPGASTIEPTEKCGPLAGGLEPPATALGGGFDLGGDQLRRADGAVSSPQK